MHSVIVGILFGASLLLLLPQAGCVLPGPLRGVGGQVVEGRFVDESGRSITQREIVLVQGHFEKLDQKTFLHLTTSSNSNGIERAVLPTDGQGKFSHKLAGFAHCHPIWILPPLFTLPAQISGDARHGSFFLIKTPEPGGCAYEVAVGRSTVVVRVFDDRKGRLQKSDQRRRQEDIYGGCESIPWTFASGRTGFVDRITLEIVRK